MPLAFSTWQRPRRSWRRRPYASLSRIALLWRNQSAKLDPASVAQSEDKGDQKDKQEKDPKEKEQDSRAKEKEPAKDKSADKPTSSAGDGKANKGESDGGSKSEEKKEDKPRKAGTLGDLLKDPDSFVEAPKPDKPPAARIVAYSDSEGEDEPFRLTRRKKKKSEDADKNAETEEEREEESTSVASQIDQALHQTPRLFKAVRLGTKRGITKLKRDAGWGLLLQFLLLWLFRKWKRKEAQRIELLTLAISLPDALACAAELAYPSSRLPGKLPAVLQFVESWARPAALFQLTNKAQQLVRRKKRRRILTTISQSARLFEEAEQQGTTTPGKKFKNALPRRAAKIADCYVVELTEMRRILEEEHHCRLPQDRFDDTNAELLRFAASAGLLEAASPEEKAHAVQEGSKRVQKTLEWTRRRRFMSPAQLKEWNNLVRWQGTNSEGWPILVIKISQACSQVQAEKAGEVADVIVSQMQRAMTEVFSNQRGPDRVVVIMDASSANSLQTARHVNIFKETAVSLNKHYPFRLDKLFIVDLPSQLRWVLATLRHMLHPATKQKIHLVTLNDPALPLPAAHLQTPEEQALLAEEKADSGKVDKSRRVSIPALPVGTPPVGQLTRLFSQKIDEEEEESPSDLSRLPSPPKRRVRIMELPFREFDRKPSRAAYERSSQLNSPSSGILRPALKRSTSVGVLGLEVPRRSEDRKSGEFK